MRTTEPTLDMDEETLSSGEAVLIVSSLITLFGTLIAVAFGI